MSGKVRLEGETAIIAQKILIDVCNFLRKFKVSYSLDAGTLLGIYREGRLLPWDNDIDLAILSTEWDRYKLAAKCFHEHGFDVTTRYNKIEFGPIAIGSPRIIKLKKLDVTVDIFVKHSDGERVFWVESGKHIVKAVAASHYSNFEEIYFNKVAFPAPSDVDGYLTARYGVWREPVMKYNYKKDDHAIVNVGTAKSVNTT